jgi:hypothetical protein
MEGECIMLKPMTALWVTGVVLTSGLLSSALQVRADAEEAALQAAATSTKTHCVMQLEPVENGRKNSESTQLGCFETFSEAIGAATSGAVRLSEDATPQSLTEDSLQSAGVFLIGIDYDQVGYRGRSFTWTTSNPFGCYRGARYSANYIGGFNNKLTSTKAFSGCRKNTSYSGLFQTGFFVTCFPNCLYIGDFLNNETSSKSWRR